MGSLKEMEGGWQFYGDRRQSLFGPSSFAFQDFRHVDLSPKVAQKIATEFKRGIPEALGRLTESRWNSSMNPFANFNETGLLDHHAYAVVGAVTPDELGVGNQTECMGNETFLLISNPHGVTDYDWKGCWSLQSDTVRESQSVQEILAGHLLPPGINTQVLVSARLDHRQQRFLHSGSRPSLFNSPCRF